MIFTVGAGGWTGWGNWGVCSPTCGIGSQIRIRNCTNPPPANAEGACEGFPYDIRVCNTSGCLGEKFVIPFELEEFKAEH